MVTFDALGSLRCRVGEGPVWVASGDELWWVDLPKGTWYRQNWQTGVATERHLGDRVSVVVPGIGARHIAAIGKRLAALESSGPVHVASVEPAELGDLRQRRQGRSGRTPLLRYLRSPQARRSVRTLPTRRRWSGLTYRR